MIFPVAGLSLEDIEKVAAIAPNKRAAAKKLGMGERQFYSVIKQKGLSYLFDLRKPRSRCVSKEDIESAAAEGYTRKDAAFILGISEWYLKDLIHLWKLQDAFTVRKGKASWVARRGYAV